MCAEMLSIVGVTGGGHVHHGLFETGNIVLLKGDLKTNDFVAVRIVGVSPAW